MNCEKCVRELSWYIRNGVRIYRECNCVPEESTVEEEPVEAPKEEAPESKSFRWSLREFTDKEEKTDD